MTASPTLRYCPEQPNGRGEYLALSFSPLGVPLRSRWRNNGVSADFLGDYVVTFLPAEGEGGAIGRLQNEIRHAVTYIANEFLENAMKYHDHEVDIPIGIRLELMRDRITVSMSNVVDAEQEKRYRSFIDRITGRDAAELLLGQLEEHPDGAPVASCVGLLTMISDYGARLDWRFESYPRCPGATMVTTSAVLSLDFLQSDLLKRVSE